MSNLKIRNEKNEIVGEVEYDIITKPNIFFIEEIAIYGENKLKGYGTRLLYNLLDKYGDVRSQIIFGISTNSAIPFWKKLGATFAEEKSNGDIFFRLKGVDLFLYIRDKRKIK